MTKNPFSNAVLAAAYICLVASVMYYGPQNVGPIDSVIVPISILSLFVLSALVMGSLFLYQPIRLYLDNQKEQAIGLFAKTLGAFTLITALLVATLFFAAAR